MSYTLVIGNKRYSSWSLRAHLALAACDVPFEEVVIPLGSPATKARIREYSPTGRVPVLLKGDLTIWDSLAIGEYLAEAHPGRGLWPASPRARAVARAVTAEMHAGFGALRRHMPMDLRRSREAHSIHSGVRNDIARVTDIWRQLRGQHRHEGPYLFGAFTLADCAYAPVATRFRTYGTELDEICEAYVDTIFATSALKDWVTAAGEEPWLIDNA